MFGIGLIRNSISLAFIFTPLLVISSVIELRAVEEPELEKRLGRDYIEYKKMTPMFLPRLKR